MSRNTELAKEIRKATRAPRKFIYTLEEIIDMLAKHDDAGHGDKIVQIEDSEGTLHSISEIKLEDSKIIISQ